MANASELWLSSDFLSRIKVTLRKQNSSEDASWEEPESDGSRFGDAQLRYYSNLHYPGHNGTNSSGYGWCTNSIHLAELSCSVQFSSFSVQPPQRRFE